MMDKQPRDGRKAVERVRKPQGWGSPSVKGICLEKRWNPKKEKFDFSEGPRKAGRHVKLYGWGVQVTVVG